MNETVADETAKSVVMNFEHVTNFDYTTVQGVQEIKHSLARRKAHLVICNLRPQLKASFLRLKHKVHVAESVEGAVSLIHVIEAAQAQKSLSQNGLNVYTSTDLPIEVPAIGVNVPDDVTTDGGETSADEDEISVDLRDVISE